MFFNVFTITNLYCGVTVQLFKLLSKYAFRVSSEKFLGFMVHNRRFEVNLKKIKAILEMKSPAKVKEVQQLMGCIATLNRFVARAIDRYFLFFAKEGSGLLLDG